MTQPITITNQSEIESGLQAPGGMKRNLKPGKTINPNTHAHWYAWSLNADVIPAWKALWRKANVLRILSQKKWNGPSSQRDYVTRMSQIQSQASQSKDIGEKTVALWKMENLGYSLARYRQPDNTLNDSLLPIETQPIAHIGMGVAAVEVGRFLPSKITEIIETLSQLDYHLFAYESVGIILAVYPSKWFRFYFGLSTTMKLPRFDAPEPEAFVDHFSGEIQRVIAHGYGRGLYFRTYSLDAAVRTAIRTHFLQVSMVVQGIGFAYAMVNHRDLYQVLEASESLKDSFLVRAFQSGVIFALKFREWATPGFLAVLQPKASRLSEMIAIAQSEIDKDRKRGALTNFAVQWRSDK